MERTFFYPHIHLTGIKGVAMTAFALWCKDSGMTVTGSDVADDFPTKEALSAAKIPMSIGFEADHIPKNTSCLVYTGAHGGSTNIEVIEAKRRGIPVYPQGIALGKAMNGKRGISVAGCHGKTTTSAFLAHVFSTLGQSPSYAIGCGMILPDMVPGAKGTGDAFIVEADEYMTDPIADPTPRFMWQHPEILVVTNIDYDHPDVYKTIVDVQDAFVQLAKQSSTLVINCDDKNSHMLREFPSVVTYGASPDADVRIMNIRFDTGRTYVDFSVDGIDVGTATLHIPGRHNASNAAAVLAACRSYGLPIPSIIDALSHFRGTRRRSELIGEMKNGTIIYDDYAHHPGEIEATLSGIRAWYPKHHITCVFQPHTYSRTKSLMAEFSRCFRDANVVIIADIYASAREHDTLGITSETLVSQIHTTGMNVLYAHGYDDVVGHLRRQTAQGPEVIVFMGAGDIADWPREYLKKENT